MRRFLAVAVLALGTFVPFSPPTARALPPSPEENQWNEGPEPTQMQGESDTDFLIRYRNWLTALIHRLVWNCYNYAVSSKTTKANGDPVRAQPGKGQKWPNIGQQINAADMCTKVKARAIADGLKAIAWNPGDPIPTPPAGENLVALGALAGPKFAGGDYHWWRLNGDGTWSHKRGGTKAKTTYTDNTGTEKPLTDPRDAAQRDGYDLCGFMTVPKQNAPALGPLAAVPVCTPSNGTVLAQAVAPSGVAEPQRVLTSAEVAELATRLPTFSPSNEVPEPTWISWPPGSYQGFHVITSVHGLGSIPPVMRAFAGVVEVIPSPSTPSPRRVFYADDHGLELFMFTHVMNQQPETCYTDEGPVPLTPCQCHDGALGTNTVDVQDGLPGGFSLMVTPNPGRMQTLQFELPKPGPVEIGVYDLAGRRLASPVHGYYPAGVHTKPWSGHDDQGRAVAAGVYFFKLRSGEVTRITRVVRIE